MVFIRKKKIYGQEYAYLVTNKWTDKGSRQKAKYLGKVLSIAPLDEKTFGDYITQAQGVDLATFIKNHTKEEIVSELIKHELTRRSFKPETEDPSSMSNGVYCYKDKKLFKKKSSKEVILEMNEGFLCSHSLDKLLNAKITGYDEREKGIKLAKVLLEAGLKADKEIFVLLFEKFA